MVPALVVGLRYEASSALTLSYCAMNSRQGEENDTRGSQSGPSANGGCSCRGSCVAMDDSNGCLLVAMGDSNECRGRKRLDDVSCDALRTAHFSVAFVHVRLRV